MSIPTPTRHRRLAALAAGALALGGGVALASGGGETSDLTLAGLVEDVSGPCDEAEHADDPRCTGAGRSEDDDRSGGTSTTTPASGGTGSPTGPSAPAAAVPDEVRTIDAAGAGTVVVAVESGQLRLVAVHPADGWFVEVEHAAGREVEVDLTRGSVEVDVDVEIEDGRVRERVRVEDDAAGTEVRTEDGVVTRVEDDGSGSGHDGSDDVVDDRSGHDGADDDRSGSSDDDGPDDRGGDDSSAPGDDDGTEDQGRGDR